MRKGTKKKLIWAGSLATVTGAFVPIGMFAFRNEGTVISNFENVLDYTGVPIGPEGARPLDINPFSDNGAWHAYSLPKDQDTDVFGGFAGPLYIDKVAGRYLSRSFNIIKLLNVDTEKQYNLGAVNKKNIQFKSYPGGLWQEYKLDDFTLQLDLMFVTDKSAMIKTNIINNTKDNLKLSISWEGKMFDDALNIVFKDKGYQAFDKKEFLPDFFNGVSVDFGNPRSPYQIGNWQESKIVDENNSIEKMAVEDWKYQIQIDKQNKTNTQINAAGTGYEMKMENDLTIKKGESYSIYQTNSFSFTKNERGIKGFEENRKQGDPYQYNPNDKVDVNDYEEEGEYKKVDKMLSSKEEAEKAIESTKARWDKYLEKSIGNDSILNEPYQRGAVKSIETLTNNWRGHAGYLGRQGITPSLSMDYFNGFWAWDSWKQAVAVARFEPELAKDNIRTLFDWQARDTKLFKEYYGNDLIAARDMGMIPDYIAFRKSETNWRDTKPPLSGWAIWEVYKQTGDIEFLKEMYKKVVAYHNWWYKNRDNDKNGVLEYGGTVNEENNSVAAILEAAGWESGLDNAPRFDINGYGENDEGIKVLENTNPNNNMLVGYSINQESICLNSFAYQEKQFLILMAKEMLKNNVDYADVVTNVKDGLKIDDMKSFVKENGVGWDLGKSFENDIKQLEKDSNNLSEYVNNYMYDKETNFFYDKSMDSENVVGKPLVNRGKGSEGWIPLFANISTQDNAKGVKNTMMRKYTFNNKLPFGSASLDNPKFAPDKYWRGPVWLDQAYFAVEGLNNYGFKGTAQRQSIKLLDNADGYTEKGMPIRETYNPLTGKGQDSKNFSWSAGMLLLMYMDFIKS